MTAIPLTSQSQSVAPGLVTAPTVTDAEIDASCQAPILLLFANAAVWLFIGSVLGLLATLKFHQPEILANCAWFTYGRVHPAQMNAFIYGFGVPTGLAVLLWIVCQTGRVRLALPQVVVAGALLWNAGVTLGLIGILYGDSTGFEWLEMPRYGSIPMLAGYLIIGVMAMLTLHQRRERALQISQWFLLTALLWFAWIYTTANFLLVAFPARGVVQPVIDSWYINNLTNIWFGFIGIATLFYLVPKLIDNPLYSRYLAVFLFWTLLFFGSWTAVGPGAPMPAWIPAVSTVGTVLLLIPTLAFAITLKKTMECQTQKAKTSLPFQFLFFAPPAYLLSRLALVVTSLARVSVVTQFTWFTPAVTQLFLYGFFAMTMFGAIYYIAPRLLGTAFPSPKLVKFHFSLALFGILLYSLPLAIGGVRQGYALNDASLSLQNTLDSWLMCLRVSTLGELLMVLANLLLLVNLGAIIYCRASVEAKAAWVANKIAGVRP